MKFFTIYCVLVSTVAASNLAPLYPRYLEAETPAVHRGAHSMSARITGGETASEGQFPYQVGLKLNVGGKNSFCGGTLISMKDVLTAAHCCEGAVEIEVILGSVEIFNETEPSRVSMKVSKENVTIHEDWDSTRLTNDICIIKLPKEVELSDHIKVADLPVDDSDNYFDKTVIASGWGRDSDQSQTVSSVLKFIKSKVISNTICNIFFMGIIKDTNLCTSGAGGMSTCNGDSGGPLVLETKDGNNTSIVGITSFGISFGCEVGWPAVFTRVSKYLKWIKQNTNQM